MSGHTPEPWHEYSADEWPSGSGHLASLGRLDYERAARCVNALAGLNPAAIPEVIEFVRVLSRDPCHVFEKKSDFKCACTPCRARALVAEMEKQT